MAHKTAFRTQIPIICCLIAARLHGAEAQTQEQIDRAWQEAMRESQAVTRPKDPAPASPIRVLSQTEQEQARQEREANEEAAYSEGIRDNYGINLGDLPASVSDVTFMQVDEIPQEMQGAFFAARVDAKNGTAVARQGAAFTLARRICTILVSGGNITVNPGRIYTCRSGTTALLLLPDWPDESQQRTGMLLVSGTKGYFARTMGPLNGRIPRRFSVFYSRLEP